eukprot:scaffold7169_cov26-Tisochrysis_lutea.AAC.1
MLLEGGEDSLRASHIVVSARSVAEGRSAHRWRTVCCTVRLRHRPRLRQRSSLLSPLLRIGWGDAKLKGAALHVLSIEKNIHLILPSSGGHPAAEEEPLASADDRGAATTIASDADAWELAGVRCVHGETRGLVGYSAH